ncbi:MAG: zinc-binding dehydrogenase [Planctomycetota bacterium]|nr:zinc-binding dehydrogenase [Planctomycetota bacterium]MDA1138975.1 zinc-binding dehydrogenase [Planctomycetota bacterium]
MKAVWLEKHGGPENLIVVERPDPRPKHDEVIIAVKAGGLNHLDIWVRMGGARPFPLPLVPGTDMAGVVAEAGELSALQPGDEVVVYPCVGKKNTAATESGIDPMSAGFQFLGAHRDGAYAEKCAVPAINCIPKPAGLSWEEAAAVPVNYITAWHMLIARANLQAGETVLIQAAGSGVSTAAIQISRMLGARVIATSSTSAKLEHARTQGADEVINYRDENVSERVLELTGGEGCAVVFDHAGAATFGDDMAALATGGRLVVCGTTTGAEVTINLATLYRRSQSVLGSTLGTRTELRAILAQMEAGRLGRPVIDRVASLNEVADMHRYLESGQQTGKVVIKVAK